MSLLCHDQLQQFIHSYDNDNVGNGQTLLRGTSHENETKKSPPHPPPSPLTLRPPTTLYLLKMKKKIGQVLVRLRVVHDADGPCAVRG